MLPDLPYTVAATLLPKLAQPSLIPTGGRNRDLKGMNKGPKQRLSYIKENVKPQDMGNKKAPTKLASKYLTLRNLP